MISFRKVLRYKLVQSSGIGTVKDFSQKTNAERDRAIERAAIERGASGRASLRRASARRAGFRISCEAGGGSAWLPLRSEAGGRHTPA